MCYQGRGVRRSGLRVLNRLAAPFATGQIYNSTHVPIPPISIIACH